MFDVMSYADRNDVEVSIRKGHDGRTVWEIFLRDHKLGMTEFTRIIDIEFKGRLDQDAYLEHRCDEIMDKIHKEASAEAAPLFFCAQMTGFGIFYSNQST